MYTYYILKPGGSHLRQAPKQMSDSQMYCFGPIELFKKYKNIYLIKIPL